MIKLIINISEDIYCLIDEEAIKKLNKYLLSLHNKDFNFISNEIKSYKCRSYMKEFSANKKNILISLDYDAMDYAQTLAYIFKIEENYIYSWIFQKIQEPIP